MKKIFLILVMAGMTTMNAQQKETPRTISVSGNAPMETSIEKYRIKATLSMDQLYYADARIENLAQLKKQYFDILTDKGIDVSKFEEKEVEYFSLGYQREGTILYYETTSESTAMKLAKTNFQGVQVQFQIKKTLTPEKQKEALDMALEDARSNAAFIAKTIGTTIGEITFISSNYYDNKAWMSYYGEYEEQYSVNVIFAMN